jgi:two-component system sensor histidine kinase UhpB
VEAATRVSGQWLKVVLADLEARPADEQGTRLLAVAASVGRVRAHQLEIRDGAGVLRHVSPPPTYKVGRAAPEWFATLVALDLPVRHFALGDFRLSLHPDASRAVLDAWDELLALAGWGLLLLLALFAAAAALARALRPLEQVMGALERTGAGRFDTRLPGFATPELARLSRAFNGMADRLQAAVNDNVRLDTQRELAERMQARLAAERRDIARELHDELAQGITAVRALAGAIVQRAPDESALHVPAQGIVAVTGEMQDGVRRILQRLRPSATGLAEGWSRSSPAGAPATTASPSARLELGDGPVAAETAAVILRAVQEGLTNVLRHARASRVDFALVREGAWLHLAAGRRRRRRPAFGPGRLRLGLAGMGERIAALGGHLLRRRRGRLLHCRPSAGHAIQDFGVCP